MAAHLLVSELFYSIQGESTWVGFPCCFIRLAGCNLRCSYCDARYTYEEAGTPMTAEVILAWLGEYPGVLVELTGGEPLLQKPVYDLIQALLEHDRRLLLETNGSLDLQQVPDQVHIICDLKCPGSGMEIPAHRLCLDQLAGRRRRGCRDNLKFVLSSVDDFHWALCRIRERECDDLPPVLFSPVSTLFPAGDLAELMLRERVPARLQIQLHTLLWPERRRGA